MGRANTAERFYIDATYTNIQLFIRLIAYLALAILMGELLCERRSDGWKLSAERGKPNPLEVDCDSDERFLYGQPLLVLSTDMFCDRPLKHQDGDVDRGLKTWQERKERQTSRDGDVS